MLGVDDDDYLIGDVGIEDCGEGKEGLGNLGD